MHANVVDLTRAAALAYKTENWMEAPSSIGSRIALALVLILATLLSLPVHAQALQSVILNDKDQEFLIGDSSEWLGDPSAEWQLQDVMSPKLAAQFKASLGKYPNFGHRYKVVWLKFSLHNGGSCDSWVLEVAREWIDKATLFCVHGCSDNEVFEWNRSSSVRWPLIAYYRPLLNFSLAPGQTKTYLLRIQAQTSIAVHGRITSRTIFEADHERYVIGYGVFYGAIASLALFNFLLWTSIRAPGFLALGVTLLAYGIGEASGHGHLTLLHSAVWLSDPRICLIGLLVAGAGILQVARTMLKTESELPRWDLLLRVLAGTCLVAVVPATITLSAHALAFYTLAIAVPTVVGVGVARAASGDPDAIAFAVAMVAWLAPASVAIGGILGIIPEVPIVENAAHLGAIAMMVLLSLTVARQVHRVNFASQRFVPREFLSLLGRKNVSEVRRGDATRRVMTVVFADVRGFTTRSENYSPEVNFAWLNRYLEIVEALVRRENGFINQYYGDGIMALFESADAALRASCDIIAQLEETGDLGDGVPVRIGIGIHTGILMLGTIGGAERLDTGVVGDTVNTAARIESLTKQYGYPLLISGATESILRERENFEIRRIDTVTPRGRSGAVTLYAVTRGTKSLGRPQQ